MNIEVLYSDNICHGTDNICHGFNRGSLYLKYTCL